MSWLVFKIELWQNFYIDTPQIQEIQELQEITFTFAATQAHNSQLHSPLKEG